MEKKKKNADLMFADEVYNLNERKKPKKPYMIFSWGAKSCKKKKKHWYGP